MGGLRKLIRKPSAKLGSDLCPTLSPRHAHRTDFILLSACGPGVTTQAGLAHSLGMPFFHPFITVGCTLGANDMRLGPLPSRESGSVGLEGPTSPDLLWALPGGVGHGPDSLSAEAGALLTGVCSHCRQQGAWMPRRAAPLLRGTPAM